jgi:hypothetical protein
LYLPASTSLVLGLQTAPPQLAFPCYLFIYLETQSRCVAQAHSSSSCLSLLSVALQVYPAKIYASFKDFVRFYFLMNNT